MRYSTETVFERLQLLDSDLSSPVEIVYIKEHLKVLGAFRSQK